MTNLIPLSEIPYVARRAEAAARHDLREAGADALEAARYEIHEAEGCYSGASPRTHGWTVTRAAAEALSRRIVRMPGGSQHEDTAYTVR